MEEPGKGEHAVGQAGMRATATDAPATATDIRGTDTGGAAPTAATSDGGEVRRQLDRAPGERYRQPAPAIGGPSPTRRLGVAAGVTIGAAVVTFALITFDIGPGLLVIGIVEGWLTGLALAGGAPAGKGAGAGRSRAAGAAALAITGLAGGLLLDALRAYAIGGVLLPWEYALARFGLLAPVAIALAAVAGAIRGR